jgi:hypothetical protein
MIIEAMANNERWVCHAFLGCPVLAMTPMFSNGQPLFSKLANGESIPIEFKSNGHTYNMGYYLAGGIYLMWAKFVTPLREPKVKKLLLFHNAQAAAKKDLEIAFGILQA